MNAEREPAKRSDREASSDAVTMYREAYEEGKRAVDDQLAELESMRQRSAQFMAFVGASTGFLVGAGLTASSGKRDTLFYVLASIGSALSTLSIIGLLVLLLSIVSGKKAQPAYTADMSQPHTDLRAQWNFRNLPGTLVLRWIDPDVGSLDPWEFYRELALTYQRKLENNDLLLRKTRTYYWMFLIVASAQVVFWGIVVWKYA